MAANPLIITCAVVGAELTKKDTPYLPVTPDRIVKSAQDAVNAGASIIHLHVRNDQGKPTQNVDLFRDITKQIKENSNCIIQYSTGGAIGTQVGKRCAPLKLKPDMASLSMGTMNFGQDIFENSEDTIRTISRAIKKQKIMPELEIFDAGMMDNLTRFLKKKWFPKKFHVNFVLGVPGGMSGDLENLIWLSNRLKPGQTWSVSGIGKYQLPLTTHAIAMGGHVRVGFEDNIFYRKGELASTNARFVKRVKRIAIELERPIATAQQAREILGI